MSSEHLSDSSGSDSQNSFSFYENTDLAEESFTILSNHEKCGTPHSTNNDKPSNRMPLLHLLEIKKSQEESGDSTNAKLKCNLTTSSFFKCHLSQNSQLLPTAQNPVEESGAQHQHESYDPNNVPSTSNQKLTEQIHNYKSIISNEESYMFDAANAFAQEIQLLDEECKGNLHEKLLRRQSVFIRWIDFISERNIGLLKLLESHNQVYRKQIRNYRQAIKQLKIESESSREESVECAFKEEGIAVENKYTRKLIEALTCNLQYREEELQALINLKTTCEKKKTSFYEVLGRLQDGKDLCIGEELTPFFKFKSNSTLEEQERLEKQLQRLQLEKKEMEMILENKDRVICQLNKCIQDQLSQSRDVKQQAKGVQTIVSFDHNLNLDGHKDLFIIAPE